MGVTINRVSTITRSGQQRRRQHQRVLQEWIPMTVTVLFGIDRGVCGVF